MCNNIQEYYVIVASTRDFAPVRSYDIFMPVAFDLAIFVFAFVIVRKQSDSYNLVFNVNFTL